MSNLKNYNMKIADLCAKTLYRSRKSANVSRRKLSLGLKISESTIKCWESGQGSPSLKSILDWFRFVDANPFLYLLGFFWNEDFGNINEKSSIKDLKKALCAYYAKVANAEELRKMNYIIFGDHGSDLNGIYNMISAHLHTSMRSRIMLAEIISTAYDVSPSAHEKGGCKDNSKLFKNAIAAAKKSHNTKKNSYAINVITPDYERAVSAMLTKSRMDAGIDQAQMAKALGKTGKTIKHWESTGQLAFLDLCRWFNCTGKSVWHYAREAFGITNIREYTEDDRKIAEKLVDYVKNKATDDEIRTFAFVDFGTHGSSFISMLELIYEYVCTSPKTRAVTSRALLASYYIEKESGRICNTEYIMPNLDKIEKSIKKITNEAKAQTIEE